jgi:hypothetical protein
MEWNRDSFAEAQNTTFKLTAANGESVDVTLVEVTETKETARQRSFSIVFSLPSTHRAEQGLYDVQHETLGDMQLFLVPVGFNEANQEMEAVFNILRTDR